MFAYGSTGSGKTHTISGGAMKVDGMIQQAVTTIRQRLVEEGNRFINPKLSCYMVQLYKSDLVDLLRPSNVLPVALDVVQDGRNGLVEVDGAFVINPSTEDFLADNGD